MAGIFKAYDIRGTYPDQVTEEIAFKVGYYFKDLLDQDDLALGPFVVVSRDMRSHSVPLANALKKGLRARGVAVIDIPRVIGNTEEVQPGHFDGITIRIVNRPVEKRKAQRQVRVPVQVTEYQLIRGSR